MFKRILVALLVVSCVAAIALPATREAVDAALTSCGIQKQTQITAEHLPFLELVFFTTQMYKVEEMLPVVSWFDLYAATYVTDKGKELKLCNSKQAALLSIVFDLGEFFIWDIVD